MLARVATDARARMIGSMQRLLQTKGYSASGLIELVADSRAPKGSIYHHFPGGKEEIAAAAIRASGAEAAAATARALAGARTPAAGLRVVLQWLSDQLASSNYRYGCPIATTTLEIASESDVVQEACAEAYKAWHAAIADRLVVDGFRKRPAEDAATLVLSAMEGALILCRAQRSVRPLKVLADNVRALLDSSR